jgi:hypothetical protein
MSEPESEAVESAEIVHGLKNQLCIILGFCELLMDDAANDERRRADLQEIHKAAARAIEMTAEVSSRLR